MSDKNTVTYSSKIMADGQVTIPKDIREILGVASRDIITSEMTGEAGRSVLRSEEDGAKLVAELRNCK